MAEEFQQGVRDFGWALWGLWKKREEGRKTIAGQSIRCPVLFSWYVLCCVIELEVRLHKEETPEKVVHDWVPCHPGREGRNCG